MIVFKMENKIYLIIGIAIIIIILFSRINVESFLTHPSDIPNDNAVDMSDPGKIPFCDTFCHFHGYNSGRFVNSNVCNKSESFKSDLSKVCCCSSPPTNSYECLNSAKRFYSNTGIFYVNSIEECKNQADIYCKSINKQWVIYTLIDLSQCCGITCN